MSERKFLLVHGALALVAVVSAAPASATASLSCSIDDKSLKLEVTGIASHGFGEVLTNFDGTAEVRLRGGPDALKSLMLERSSVTQYWLDGPLFKLRLYSETSGSSHSSVEIVIEARRYGRDETDYPGTYRLEFVSAGSGSGPSTTPVRAKGKVSCSVG